jgi:MFS family permease
VSAGYWRLACANTVSQLGSQVSLLAVTLLAVVTLRAPAAQVGIISACQPGAYLVAGIPAGLVADQVSKRSVMLCCDLFRAGAVASVPVAAASGVLTVAQVYAVVCVTGMATVFADVARQAILPRLVTADALPAANARLASGQSAARLSGPAVAGVLIQLAGAATAMTADAVSYLLSAAFIRGLPSTRDQVVAGLDRSLSARTLAGLRHAFGSRRLRDLALAAAWGNLVTGIVGVALALRMARDLRMTAAQIGVCYAAGALGGLIGGLLIRRAGRRLRVGWVLCGSTVVMIAGTCLMALSGPGWREWAAAAGLLVSGFGVITGTVVQVTLRQQLTPPELIGRAMGSIRLVVTGAAALGCLAGGQLSGAVSTRTVLWLSAAALSATVPLLVRSPLWRDVPAGGLPARGQVGQAGPQQGRLRIADLGEDRKGTGPEQARRGAAVQAD